MVLKIMFNVWSEAEIDAEYAHSDTSEVIDLWLCREFMYLHFYRQGSLLVRYSLAWLTASGDVDTFVY